MSNPSFVRKLRIAQTGPHQKYNLASTVHNPHAKKDSKSMPQNAYSFSRKLMYIRARVVDDRRRCRGMSVVPEIAPSCSLDTNLRITPPLCQVLSKDAISADCPRHPCVRFLSKEVTSIGWSCCPCTQLSRDGIPIQNSTASSHMQRRRLPARHERTL